MLQKCFFSVLILLKSLIKISAAGSKIKVSRHGKQTSLFPLSVFESPPYIICLVITTSIKIRNRPAVGSNIGVYNIH